MSELKIILGKDENVDNIFGLCMSCGKSARCTEINGELFCKLCLETLEEW